MPAVKEIRLCGNVLNCFIRTVYYKRGSIFTTGNESDGKVQRCPRHAQWAY